MTTPPDLLRLKSFGRYEVLGRLGEGGMGELFRARDTSLGRQVAIKVLRDPDLANPVRLTRFEQEARAASILNHPNIVTIYEIGEVGGQPYIAMELVEGRTLRDTLYGSRLPMRRVLEIAVGIADGLAAAHANDIVHRDLKPENVMITTDGRVKILDFGLATRAPFQASDDDDTSPVRTPGTEPGVILGTTGYMSPEQASIAPVDFRSDQFAFGSILYEMLAGEPAFKRKTVVQTMAAIIESEPKPIAELNPSVPAPLRWILDRCLAKEPARRFDTTRELSRALTDVLEHLPEISSRGIRAQELEADLAARRTGQRRAALIAALLALALAGGVLWRTRPPVAAPATPFAAVVPAGPARRSVAVLGFRNLSGRPESQWLSTAMAEMLTTELAAGGRLRTISGEQVGRMKMELGVGEPETLAPDTLRRIGANLGTEQVLLGSYLVEPGGRLRLDLRLQDVAGGDTVVALAENGSEAALIDLVSAAGTHLRQSLGVGSLPAAEVAATRVGLPHSLEGQRLYAEGLARLRLLDALSARSLLEKAAAADPDAPLVHAALARTWSTLGYDQKAAVEAKKAFDLSAGLSREDRLSVEARYRETVHEWDKAIEIHRALHAFYPDDVEHALRLASAQAESGRGAEALATLQALRRLPGADDPSIDLTEASIGRQTGDWRRAREAAERAATRGTVLGAKLLVARARSQESYALIRLGRETEAAAAAEGARRLFAEANDPGGVATALSNIGGMQYQTGHLEEARRSWEESLSIRRRIGDQRGTSTALNNIGLVLWPHGDLMGALRNFAESAAIDRELGDRQGRAYVLENIALVQLDKGNLAAARQAGDEAARLCAEVGDSMEAAAVQVAMAHVQMSLGQVVLARAGYEQALPVLQKSDTPSYTAAALFALGDALLAQGDLRAARERHEAARVLRQRLGETVGEADSRLALARLALEEGRAAEAEAGAAEAAASFARQGLRDREGCAHAVRSAAQRALGRTAEARASAQKAAGILEGSQNVMTRLFAVALMAPAAADADAAGALRMVQAGETEAARLGLVARRLDLQLARAQVELALRPADAATHLRAVATAADERGLVLVAGKARAAMAAVPN